MKNLRNVIVRKRPMQSSNARSHDEMAPVPDFLDLAAKRAPKPKPAARLMDSPPVPHATEQAEENIAKTLSEKSLSDPVAERPAPKAAAPAPEPKKQIWDLDHDDADDAPVAKAEPAPRPVERARVAPEPSKPARAARAKTRIIGFHADASDGDVFATQAAGPSATAKFPAGWIVIVDGPGRGTSFSIASGVSTIGRGEDQTICLDFGDTSVSRQNHASIAYDEEQNQFFIGHGGKSNIVRRNGAPVLATETLAHADLIRIGKTTLRFVALCGPDFTWTLDEPQDGDAPAA